MTTIDDDYHMFLAESVRIAMQEGSRTKPVQAVNAHNGGVAMTTINQTTSKHITQNAVATYTQSGMGYNHAYATLIGGIRAAPPQGDEFLDEVKREFLALVNEHYFDHGLKYGLREQGKALDFLCTERATKLEIIELKDGASAGDMAHTLYEAYLVPEYN